MVITINRNSGVFEPALCDELNKAFASINKKIENYQAADLNYKEEVQLLGTNTNSFRCGNLVCIREKYVMKERFVKLTKVGKILATAPYDIWCNGLTQDGEAVICHIKNNEVFLQGTLNTYPKNIYVVTDFIIPQKS